MSDHPIVVVAPRFSMPTSSLFEESHVVDAVGTLRVYTAHRFSHNSIARLRASINGSMPIAPVEWHQLATATVILAQLASNLNLHEVQRGVRIHRRRQRTHDR